MIASMVLRCIYIHISLYMYVCAVQRSIKLCWEYRTMVLVCIEDPTVRGFGTEGSYQIPLFGYLVSNYQYNRDSVFLCGVGPNTPYFKPWILWACSGLKLYNREVGHLQKGHGRSAHGDTE